jgi:fatty acid-binding protein DegV
MDLETVRECFKKYTSYLEASEKVMMVPGKINIDELSIVEMDRITQTMFMNYVMNNSQKISPTSIACVLYKHMNSLIRNYIEEDQKKPVIKVINVGNDSKSKEVKKGWLW